MRPCDTNNTSQSFTPTDALKLGSSATVVLESSLHDNELVALTQDLNRPGAEAYLAPAGQGANSTWEKVSLDSFNQQQGDVFILRATTPVGGKLCLGFPVWSNTVPTALNCDAATADLRQQWVSYAGNGYDIGLRNRGTNQCLTISNNPISNGRKLTMRDCDMHRADQRFEIEQPTPFLQ